MSSRILKRFPYLEGALEGIAVHRVRRLYLEGPGGDSAVVESTEPPALMIRRLEFDALLVELAVKAGVELVAGADIVQAVSGPAGVSLTARDGRSFEAPLAIAADGVNSVVARRMGLNPGWPASAVALDMMEETPRTALRDVDPSTMWVAYGFSPRTNGAKRDGRTPEGYAYIFPKRDHVNVGVGYVLDHYRSAIGVPPYELQRGFVDHLKHRGILEGESVRRNFTPFLIPVGGPLPRLGHGRVLLAGDAGGFVNGFTAEGIYYAMVSGELAARAIVETKPETESTLSERYRAACDREVGTELRDSVLVQRYLFGSTRRITRVIEGARGDRQMTRSVLDFAMGRISYRDLRRRMLTRSPLLALRFAWERIRHGHRA
jgi:flavin-dependent dehydrogenase